MLSLLSDAADPAAFGPIRGPWLDALDRHIAHRGPDGSGRVELEGAPRVGTRVCGVLLHRRLSIIDHASGQQPMVLRAGGDGPVETAVVFNGCIYNHRELRGELSALGHRFTSDHSDTEVLLHGSARWGGELPTHLDGMFAYAAWDRRNNRLRLARDRAGEKPLYYCTFAGEEKRSHFAFASTVPALVSVLRLATGRAPEVCKHRLLGWVLMGFGHETPYTAIHSVLPDSTVVVQPRGPNSLHWRFTTESWGRGVPRSRQVVSGVREPIEAVLSRSVASRLEADVPLGCFLSGGIDSPLIAAFAKRERPDLSTFTVRMPDTRYDESAQAEQIARALGTRHTTLDCEANPASDLIALVGQLGLPLGDSSLLPTHWVSRATRRHAVVALSGDGGDELFGGYRRYAAAKWLARFGGWLGLLPASMLWTGDGRSKREMLARLSAAARGWGYPDLVAIFPKAMAQRLLPQLGSIACPRRFADDGDAQRWDFMEYLPGDLLRKVDTASMAVALEVRAPFLSRELIERQLGAPASGYGKLELRELARSILPAGIADAPKSGFAIPIGEWFRTNFGGMRDLMHAKLGTPDGLDPLRAVLPIDHRRVGTLMKEHEAGDRDHSQRLYHLIVLAIWGGAL